MGSVTGSNRWRRFVRSTRRILTLRCDACQRLESDRLDRRLSLVDAASRWGHLLACRACRRTSIQMGQIEQAIALRTIDYDAKLSDQAKDRIATRMRKAISDGESNQTN